MVWRRSKKASKIFYRTHSAKISTCWKSFKIRRIELHSKNRLTVLNNFRFLCMNFRLSRHNNGIKIETSENTKVNKALKNEVKSNAKKGDKNQHDNPRKFETYFKFQAYFNSIHSHQTLAINRGENLKVNKNIELRQNIYKTIKNCFLSTVHIGKNCDTGSHSK